MERKELLQFKNQNCRITMHGNLVFHGKVLDVTDSSLHICDKYTQTVLLSIDEITAIYQISDFKVN